MYCIVNAGEKASEMPWLPISTGTLVFKTGKISRPVAFLSGHDISNRDVQKSYMYGRLAANEAMALFPFIIKCEPSLQNSSCSTSMPRLK